MVDEEELARVVKGLRVEIGNTRRWAFRSAIGVLTVNVTVLGAIVASLLGAW
jgi:hypothetical protein